MQVQQLLPSMLGVANDRKLALHASETKGVLYFVAEVLRLRGASLGNKCRLFQTAVDTCVTMVRVIREAPWAVPPAAQQTFCDAMLGR